MPIADHELNPIGPERGRVNLGYCFFESALGSAALENSKSYDVIFAGSQWCIDRLAERGITNTKLLIQGVDSKIFRPRLPRKPDGQFRIFSGGKFEYRKGQDLVVKAFAKFSKGYPTAHLVCSWFNPWPQLLFSMGNEISLPSGKFAGDQKLFIELTMHKAGIAADRFTVLPQLSQSDLPNEMTNTDIGLFPNRCEGGTNLVLMEYASAGRKVIANAKTGHADIADAITYEIPASNDCNHWAVQTVDDIVVMLERAYENREQPPPTAPLWSWETAAKKIVAVAEECLTRQRETISL